MKLPPFVGTYHDRNHNLVHFASDRKFFPKNLVVEGYHNEVAIGEETDLRGFEIEVGGDDNLIYIGSRNRLNGILNVSGHRQTVQIGDDNTFEGVSLFASESTNIRIGNDCMFATGIDMRTSDALMITDRNSRLRVNPPGSVTIGDHVCLGKQVIICKGVTIAANSIVEANCFVNQSFEQEGIMIGGTPARIIRKQIQWVRPLLALKKRPRRRP